MRIKLGHWTLFLLPVLTQFGCVGAKTFHEMARPGDTVVVAGGWKQHFTRDEITVTISPASGSPIVYPPNHPNIRATINLYPDPVSSLLVSPQVGYDMTPYARTYADAVSDLFTQGDNDWWESSVFVNLPASMSLGMANISITNAQGESMSSEVEIVTGDGTPNSFATSTGGHINENQLASLGRVSHYVVMFTGSTVPYSIQLDLVHSPDMDQGGTGRAHVVNPRGDIKNAAWRDDGTNLRLILSPAKPQTLTQLSDFKIYVTGGITGLQLQSIKAVDIDGNPVAGISANITLND
jgi:hypothetical protein